MEKEYANYIRQELLTAEDVIRRRSRGNITEYVDSVTADALTNGILSCGSVKDLCDFLKMTLYRNIPDTNEAYEGNASLYFIIRYVFDLDFIMVAEPDEKRLGVNASHDFIYSPEFLDIEWYRRACENIVSVFHVRAGTAVVPTGYQFIDPANAFAKSLTDGEETPFSACMRRTLLLREKNAGVLRGYKLPVRDYVSQSWTERQNESQRLYNEKVKELARRAKDKEITVSDRLIDGVLEKLRTGAERMEREVDMWNFDEIIEKSNEFAKAYFKNPCICIGHLISGISELQATSMALKSSALYYAGYIDETVMLDTYFLNFCGHLNEYHGTKSFYVITKSQQRMAFAIYRFAFFCLGLCNLSLGCNNIPFVKLYYSAYDDVFNHGYRIICDESGIRQFKKQNRANG